MALQTRFRGPVCASDRRALWLKSMPARLVTTLLATAASLSLAACRIDTPTGHMHSDLSGTYAAAQGQVAANAPQLYPAQAGYGSGPAYERGVGAANTPMYDGYALVERAHAFDRSTYRRRPAYAFRYENTQPLVWRTADNYSMYAEPVYGGYRDYYYSPGADYPYFVRDSQYGYGYSPDGRLTAVYDAGGLLLPADRFGQVAALAADYYLRARTLRRYGDDNRYRIPVSDAYWAERGAGYVFAQEAWISAPDRRPEWRAWRRSNPREMAIYDLNPGHDNGRHLGWYKHEDGAWRHEGGGDERFTIAYGQRRADGAHENPRRGGKHGDEGGDREGGDREGHGRGGHGEGQDRGHGN